MSNGIGAGGAIFIQGVDGMSGDVFTAARVEIALNPTLLVAGQIEPTQVRLSGARLWCPASVARGGVLRPPPLSSELLAAGCHQCGQLGALRVPQFQWLRNGFALLGRQKQEQVGEGVCEAPPCGAHVATGPSLLLADTGPLSATITAGSRRAGRGAGCNSSMVPPIPSVVPSMQLVPTPPRALSVMSTGCCPVGPGPDLNPPESKLACPVWTVQPPHRAPAHFQLEPAGCSPGRAL